MNISPKYLKWSMLSLLPLFSQVAISQTSYFSKKLLDMPYEISEDFFSFYDFTDISVVQQSFRINIADNNANKVKIDGVVYYGNLWRANSELGTINFYEGTIGAIGDLVYTQPFNEDFLDVNATHGESTLRGNRYTTIDGNLELVANKDYVMKIEIPEDSRFGLYTTRYEEGSSDRGEHDIWLQLYGEVESTTDATVSFSNTPTSIYFLDTFSYFFPSKLLNRYEPDNLYVNTAKAGDLMYHSSDETIVKAEIQEQEVGVKDKIELIGYNVGEAVVYVVHGEDTISYFDVNVTNKKTVDISYQYIKYPGESEHHLLSGFEEITNYIGELYKASNVHLNFTDQGVIEFDWDLNGDGISFTLSRDELHAPGDQIPNASTFFSNFYLLRRDKSDDTHGGVNGGGTSRGFGERDVAPRYGLVAVHLFRTSNSVGSTLAHELGHNFGLVHYSSVNQNGIPVRNDILNTMDAGRVADNIYSFQSRIVHATIDYRREQGEVYDTRIQAEINNFEDINIVDNPTNQLTATTNSDAPLFYRLISGNGVINVNESGTIQILSEGTAEVGVYAYATENFLETFKIIKVYTQTCLPTTGTDVQMSCGSFTWIDGNTYTSSNNEAMHTLTNALGCDSVVTLDLTINDPTTGTDVQMSCGSFTWIDGNTYTSSNNEAMHTLTNALGCDSVVTLDLTINDPTTGTDVQMSCGSFTWIDGNTYTSSNNEAMHTLTNALGCDSVVTLDLTINDPTTGTDVQMSCGSFTWIDGNTYTSSNNEAMHTLTNALGCDSVVTLDLTINDPTTGTDVQMSCGSFTWIDGNTYTSSNNEAMHTLTNALGCDSVVTLDLTILTIDISTTLSSSSLSSNATGAAYRWLNCEEGNVPVEGAIASVFTPSMTGNYAVEVVQDGCTDTSACVYIEVTVLGGLASAFEQVSIYPNPNAGNFTINLGDLQDVTIRIFNLVGKEVNHQEHIQSTRSVVVLKEPTGVYFVEITSAESTRLFKLLLK